MSRASVLAVAALGAAAVALPAVAQDRYGPSAYPVAGATPGVVPPSGSPSVLRGRMLSWPGKQVQAAYAPPTPARAYAPQEYASHGYAPRGYVPSAYPTAAGAPRAYSPPAFSASPYAQRRYPGSTTARQPYAPPARMRQAYADRPAAAYPAQPRAYASPAYAARAATQAPSPDGWRPVFANAPVRAPMQQQPAEPAPTLSGAPAGAAALPTSIYTPAAAPEMTPAQRAAAAAPPLRTASAAHRYGYDPTEDHQVRFYSVHRPFGLQPDAAPIPPQFFTATADLSEPPGPLPTDRTVTTTTASGTRVSHLAPDTSPN